MCRNRILLACGLVMLFCAPSLWAQCSAVTSNGTAVANQVSKFTTGCNIEPSAITETGGKVGIGTAAPAATLDVKGTATIRGTVQLPSTGTATATKGFTSQPLDALASAFNSGTGKAVSQHFRWQAEVFNNDTSSPIGTMNLLYASGTAAPAETGFFIGGNGVMIGTGLSIKQVGSPNGDDVFAVDNSGDVDVSGRILICTGSPQNCVSGTVFNADTAGNLTIAGALSSFSGNFHLDNSGNLSIHGNLNVGGQKNFQIDDPLDPANRYLYHSAVESSEMMNIYAGNVTTNEHGDATVHVPAWFEALNGDFRYQLTVIGRFAQAIVASKVANHSFCIKTDKPNVEVSWQVTGVRQDAYAKANPLVVEQDKPTAERGYYLHPEVFGQPESKGISYARKLPVREKQPESAKAERTGN
jgi:hypothetical protein